MKSLYETYGQWEKRTFCDNASRRGKGVSLSPQCLNGNREFECTVHHNDGPYGKETMVLCSKCKDLLRRGARRHGYKFQSKLALVKVNAT